MTHWIAPADASLALETGTGEGIRVAILDSGIEIRHTDFVGRQLADDIIVDLEGAQRILLGDGTDPFGHGTAIASLIWQTAPDVEIGSFRVLGPELYGRSALIATAAKEAIRLGYHILNCSFSCGISSHVLVHKEWVDLAYLSQVHVVAAASIQNQVAWPAQFASVLGVECGSKNSNIDLQHRKDQLIEFEGGKIDWQVAWRENSRRSMTGSSFSAAYLTGRLARLLSVHPHISPLEAKVLLRRVTSPDCTE